MKDKSLEFKKIIVAFSFLMLFFALSSVKTAAQETVDQTIATVGDGLGSPELITYSDLMWQLALDPGVPLRPPSSEDLNRALQLLINQRLFALEAKRIPRTEPTTEEVDAEIKRVLARFPSVSDFEERLRIVGFDSVKDDNFERIISDRVKIEKYLDFRFRSFVVVTTEDEKNYFDNVFTPEFRRRNPSRIKPNIEEVRAQINTALTERKVETEIEKFLDESKRRAEIVVLSEV
jgi:hypothetical protein